MYAAAYPGSRTTAPRVSRLNGMGANTGSVYDCPGGPCSFSRRRRPAALLYVQVCTVQASLDAPEAQTASRPLAV